MKIFKINKNIRVKIKKIFADKNGQSTVEFTLLIPFLIITCIAVFQLGYVIYLKNNIKQMSREAVRAVSTTNSNVLGEEVMREGVSLSDGMTLDMMIEPSLQESRKVGDIVKVKISLNYSGFGGMITKLFGKPLLIYSENSMRMECQ
ncbi:MAG: pilus assembly protein [Actinobacteria bacterium]|nr:pilus assembly protein [Actinomycetota bacterium]